MPDNSYRVGTLHELFPDVSFPANSEPNLDWYTENSILKVNYSVPYDSETEMMETVLPYETGDGWVYITRAVPKPVDV